MDMFSLSQPAADAVYGWSNVLTIVGAVLAFVGAAGIFWSGGIRERYSDERISKNEAQTAVANKEAAVARLETEKLRKTMAWRRVSPSQRAMLIEALRGQGQHIEVWTSWVGDDPEATVYRGDIDEALTAAGVKTKYFSGWVRSVGLSVSHVPGRAFDLLTKALTDAAIEFHVKDPDPKFAPSELVIIVGTKPPPP